MALDQIGVGGFSTTVTSNFLLDPDGVVLLDPDGNPLIAGT